MEMPLQPLLVLDEVIEGKTTKIEIRQEVSDSNEVITHVSLVQDGVENRMYDMRFTPCGSESTEPHWQFLTKVRPELFDIEWTISEAILEKNM